MLFRLDQFVRAGTDNLIDGGIIGLLDLAYSVTLNDVLAVAVPKEPIFQVTVAE